MTDINQDIEALESVMKLNPGELFEDCDADEMLDHLRAVRDWDRAFASVATPDRISRLLAALKERNLDALQASSEALQNWTAYRESEARLARAVELLNGAREEFAGLPRSLCYDFTHLPAIDAFLQEQGK